MEDRLIKATELAMLVDSSIQTITSWYKWKEKHPDDELAKLLPDYTIQEGGRKTRYWKYSDVYRLIEFKNSIPHGRYGIMGDTTQMYLRSSKRYIYKDGKPRKSKKNKA